MNAKQQAVGDLRGDYEKDLEAIARVKQAGGDLFKAKNFVGPPGIKAQQEAEQYMVDRQGVSPIPSSGKIQMPPIQEPGHIFLGEAERQRKVLEDLYKEMQGKTAPEHSYSDMFRSMNGLPAYEKPVMK